jgi:hypothetical protein
VEVSFQIEPTTARWQGLVQKGGATPENPGWQFYLKRTQDPPDLSTPFSLSYCVQDGAGAHSCENLGELMPGKYHFALVRSPAADDASTATMSLFYLPENASVHVAQAFASAVSTWTTTEPFQISSCGDPLTGIMDEVRIWKTARTERELFTNAHIPLDCRNEPDLVAYYDFEDLTGTKLLDCHSTFDVPIVAGTLPDSWAPTVSPF